MYSSSDSILESSESANVLNEERNDQVSERKKKLERIESNGFLFPNDFKRNIYVREIKEKIQENSDQILSVVGRIMNRRTMGKASFLDILDNGDSIQIYIRKDAIGDSSYEDMLEMDIGDIVGIIGTLFRTKTGELSIRASQIRLLSKSLRPLPEKFHGLKDVETRYRQRYLDLIVNKETRDTFKTRSNIVRFIREFLSKKEFIEVETPMMQTIPGGAVARPFVTHHNALDTDLYLRIAPELYLKRLIIGGLDRVFEMNRNFRNEGISTRHNPEFTMIEFYQSYATYNDLIELTRSLMKELSIAVFGKTSFEYQGYQLDMERMEEITFADSILRFNEKLNKESIYDRSLLSEYARSIGIDESDIWTMQSDIFEKTVEKNLIEPTFITEYPIAISPLARRNNIKKDFADRFEFFIAGYEIANGFSELNNPIDQSDRFKDQVAKREIGDDEAMYYDEDYVLAMEYGMPPTAGEGIGIDRLVMLFTNSKSIRDVILFPTMKH